MSKFKVGDRVKVIASTSPEYEVAANIGKTGSIAKTKLTLAGSIYAVLGYWYKESDLELAPEENHKPSWDNLQAGDVLIKKTSTYKLIVQGVIGEVVVFVNDHKDRLAGYKSIFALKNTGWEVKSAKDNVKVLTLAEVAKLAGVEKVRVEG